MKSKIIEQAVSSINRSIGVYSKKLTAALLQCSNVELDGTGKIEEHNITVKKYEDIVSDLLRIKNALQSGETQVRVYGRRAEGKKGIYIEVKRAIDCAQLHIIDCEDGNIRLCSSGEKI